MVWGVIMKNKKGEIPRRQWLSSFRGWYEKSKDSLTKGKQGLDCYDCGYCKMYNIFSNCPFDSTVNTNCPLKPMFCGSEESAFAKWNNSNVYSKEETKYALIIFRAIIEHGEELGYVTGVQRKQIKELKKLENKMFGGKK
jgi:hypothetical protein